MKTKFITYWYRFFNRNNLHKPKLVFISWLDLRLPRRFCWADCVSWAFDPVAWNPFNIHRPSGCKKAKTVCYCGRYMNEKLANEHEPGCLSYVDKSRLITDFSDGRLYQSLFDSMYQEHDIMLLESEMDDIVHLILDKIRLAEWVEVKKGNAQPKTR